MKANKLLARTVGRYRVIAPLIGAAATSYALYATFQNLDAAGATWRTAMHGIVRAFAATIVLLLVAISSLALHSLVEGRGDDDAA